jgi:S-adenosylmethionine synthetase
VQVAYAIGVAKPVGLYVNTSGTAKVKLNDGEIAKKVEKIFDMRPYFIEQRFNLRTPIYAETAAYGHMGRESKVVEKVFNRGKRNEKRVKVELFPWEKLDYLNQVKQAFKI